MVNAGVLQHPLIGVQLVGLVATDATHKLRNLRADPRATIVAAPAGSGLPWKGHVGECGRPGRIRGVTTATPSYKGHRYPVEIINHCVWLYFRFPTQLS